LASWAKPNNAVTGGNLQIYKALNESLEAQEQLSFAKHTALEIVFVADICDTRLAHAC
jgi:hypothetical protein